MKISRIIVSMLAVAALIFGGCTKGGEEGGSTGTGSTPKPGAIEVAEGKDLVGYVLWDDGTPAKGVVVSDGFSCTATDDKGVYQLTRNIRARNVFLSFPQMAEITVKKNQVPDFFHSINAKANGIIRHDFTIVKRKGAVPRRFQLIIFADSQIRRKSFGEHFSNDFCPDVNKTVAESNLPTVGITCGDDGDDNLWHQKRDGEDMTYQTVADCYGALSFPMFHCAGNHDHDKSHSVPKAEGTATKDYYDYYDASVAAFEKAFNPVDYSFNYGSVHFVIMDNIRYYGPSSYDIGFTDEQIEWLRQDLSYVPTTMAVFVSLHASYYRRNMQNKEEFASLLAPYANKWLFIGHSHVNDFKPDINDPKGGKLTEWVLATPMGTFYRADINQTSEPAGYGVVTVSGTEVIDRYYKGAYVSRDEQGRMYDTSCFTHWKSEKDTDGIAWKDKVVGVVFDKTYFSMTDQWTVELWEDDKFSTVMTRYKGIDYAAFDCINATDLSKLTASQSSVILYKATPKSKSSKKKMRLVDWLGREFWVTEMTTTLEDEITGLENGGK